MPDTCCLGVWVPGCLSAWIIIQVSQKAEEPLNLFVNVFIPSSELRANE